MRNINKRLVLLVFLVAWLNFFDQVIAQNTKIRGFVDVGAAFEDDQVNFKFGEYVKLI